MVGGDRGLVMASKQKTLKQKQDAFKRECERVAEKVDLPKPDFYDDDGKNRSNEDDGNWHLVRDGVRACFDVANDNGYIQNTRVRELMGLLRLVPKSSDLVDECDDDFDECCPTCGR